MIEFKRRAQHFSHHPLQAEGLDLMDPMKAGSNCRDEVEWRMHSRYVVNRPNELPVIGNGFRSF